jgi:hypothetical protein
MAKTTVQGNVIIGGIERFLEDEYATQIVIDPANMYTDSAGTTPVSAAPEAVGLIEAEQ